MIAVEDTVLILLAAGRSQRFGDVGSKLDEQFLGRSLGLHVAVALESMPFKHRIAVTDGAKLDYRPHGFHQVHNDRLDLGMSHSVRLGVESARVLAPQAVCIALADMPRVTTAHLMRMFDVTGGSESVVASSDGVEPKPPVIFGSDHFDMLMALHGDEGARDLVKRGRHVVTNAAELIDVDTPEDLERLRELVHAPEALTRAGARRLG